LRGGSLGGERHAQKATGNEDQNNPKGADLVKQKHIHGGLGDQRKRKKKWREEIDEKVQDKA